MAEAEAEAFVLLPLLPPSFHFLPPNPSPLISAEGGKKERDGGGGGGGSLFYKASFLFFLGSERRVRKWRGKRERESLKACCGQEQLIQRFFVGTDQKQDLRFYPEI